MKMFFKTNQNDTKNKFPGFFSSNWISMRSGFDPGYPSLPFEFFIPMVERVLAREPFWWDPKHPKRAAVTGVQADSSQDVNAEL